MSEITAKDMNEVDIKRGDYVQVENDASYEYGKAVIVLEIQDAEVIAYSHKDDPCTVMLESAFLVQKLKVPQGTLRRFRDDEITRIDARVKELERENAELKDATIGLGACCGSGECS